MKLCISNIAWEKADDKQMYHLCSEMGYDGIEIAPTRIFPDNPYDHLTEAGNWAKSLQEEYALKIYSCQSIWYGRTEKIFGSNKEREGLIEYTKKALAFAEAVGAGSIVFGCPKNRNGFQKSPQENSKISTEFFNKLADIAGEYHVIVKLNRDYIGLNLDIGTILYNQEKMDSIKGYEKFISHVHISEPCLLEIKERKEHKDILNLLKVVGYDKAVSIEMQKQESIEGICKAMRYIKRIINS